MQSQIYLNSKAYTIYRITEVTHFKDMVYKTAIITKRSIMTIKSFKIEHKLLISLTCTSENILCKNNNVFF